MKEAGYEHWDEPNIGATNESGFTGLPGGMRLYNSGFFNFIGSYGRFWSSTESTTSNATQWYLWYNDNQLLGSGTNKTTGDSVRCLQDTN
jgi:uncharacterized protein (TIGR02145 family)